MIPHILSDSLHSEVIFHSGCQTFKDIFNRIRSECLDRVYIVPVFLSAKEHPVAVFAFGVVLPCESGSGRIQLLCLEV